MEPKISSEQSNLANNDTSLPTTQPASSNKIVIQPSEELVQEVESQKKRDLEERIIEEAKIAPFKNSDNPVQDQSFKLMMDQPAKEPFDNESHDTIRLKTKRSKKKILFGCIAFLILGGQLAVFVNKNLLNSVSFTKITYTNQEGSSFQFLFYTDHTTGKIQTGQNQLRSNVSRDNKLPINFSIGASTEENYARQKDCTGYTKVLDIQNSALNQIITMCDIGAIKDLAGSGVYYGSFTHNNAYYTISIGHNYTGYDLSDREKAQESLKRIGLDTYNNDIEQIVSSITIN